MNTYSSPSGCSQRNWLQALEGEIVSVHARPYRQSGGDFRLGCEPEFAAEMRMFGVAVRLEHRVAPVDRDDTYYWRFNQCLLPFRTLVLPQSKCPELSGHAWVPMDDDNTLWLIFSYTPVVALYLRMWGLLADGHGGRETGHASRHLYDRQPATAPYSDFRTKFTPKSGYGFDYASQRATWFSGMSGLWVQDPACQTGCQLSLTARGNFSAPAIWASYGRTGYFGGRLDSIANAVSHHPARPIRIFSWCALFRYTRRRRRSGQRRRHLS